MLITGMQDEDQVLRDWHVANEQVNTTESLGQSHKGVAQENQMAVLGKEDKELPSTPSPPSLRYSLEGSPKTGRRVFRCLDNCSSAFHSTCVSWLEGVRRILWLRPSSRKRLHAIRMARMKVFTRMSETRKIVTLLGRLLAPKNEVLGILSKRLVNAADLGAHLSDVQDHIVTMQQSLEYYDRVLGQSHPAYLSGLNLNSAKARNQLDRAASKLSLILVFDHTEQVIVGMFSMNIRSPRNRRPKDALPGSPVGHFYMFGVVLCMITLALAVMLCVYWWLTKQARRKRWRKA